MKHYQIVDRKMKIESCLDETLWGNTSSGRVTYFVDANVHVSRMAWARDYHAQDPWNRAHINGVYGARVGLWGPREMPCPTCKAEPGEACRFRCRPVRYHASRRRMRSSAWKSCQ